MSVLELDRVSKSFSRGTNEIVALAGVSLGVAPGEWLAVWGGSNSGKTTLLRVAAGIQAPDRGSVRFRGREITSLSAADRARLLREEVGCVWRSVPAARGLSVLEWVALPLLGNDATRIRERALETLREAGAAECAGASWQELADGDRARVRVAHALVRRPTLLLADEPTANLNQVEREELLALLRSVADERGTAILMTAPEAEHMLRADVLASLDCGKLIGTARAPRGAVVDFPRDRRAGGRGRRDA